ncbi:MAG: LptF/LptG family permease [Hyphomonadaceae bacterium]
MSGFQRYLLFKVLRTLIAIVGGLALIALLTQGLAQIDVIVENRQSIITYLWISVLAAPQIIALLMPLALFIATTGALNATHRDNEIVVAQAAGMSRWEIASPVLRIAALAALLHLGMNLWMQPMASRELRLTRNVASTDLVSSLVREGMFMSTSDGLTTYARKVNGNEMQDMLVQDARDPADEVTYIAKTGSFTEIDGIPAIVMRDGHAQQIKPSGALETLAFDQTIFDLAPFYTDEKAIDLEPSDRFLPELFYPDKTNYYDNKNADRLLAEGHTRLSDPLLNMAMALIGIIAVLGGDFSRRGYAMRIGWAAAGAVSLRLLAFLAVPEAARHPAMNILQYAIPLVTIAGLSIWYFVLPVLRRRVARRRHGTVLIAAAGA